MIRATFVFLASASVTMIVTTSAYAQHRDAHIRHVHHQQMAHRPADMPISVMPDMRRNVVFVPVGVPFAYGPAVSLAADQRYPVQADRIRPQQKAIQPLSINSIDPTTIVSRTPSGSVVLTSTRGYGGDHGHRRYAAFRTPYAPPTFHILGDASGKHMSRPVKLTHGIAPRRGFRTEPKVVFLNAKD